MKKKELVTPTCCFGRVMIRLLSTGHICGETKRYWPIAWWCPFCDAINFTVTSEQREYIRNRPGRGGNKYGRTKKC